MYEFRELLLRFDRENRRKRQRCDHRSLFPSPSRITSRLLRRLECVARRIGASHCGRGPVNQMTSQYLVMIDMIGSRNGLSSIPIQAVGELLESTCQVNASFSPHDCLGDNPELSNFHRSIRPINWLMIHVHVYLVYNTKAFFYRTGAWQMGPVISSLQRIARHTQTARVRLGRLQSRTECQTPALTAHRLSVSTGVVLVNVSASLIPIWTSCTFYVTAFM